MIDNKENINTIESMHCVVLLFLSFLMLGCVQGDDIFGNTVLHIEALAGKASSLNGNERKVNFYRFVPFDGKRRVFFLSGGGYSYKKGGRGINIGGGMRYFLTNHVLMGVNVYYDRQYHYFPLNQVGIGFEFFSNFLDVRGNLYFPIKRKKFKWKQFIFEDYIGNYRVVCRQKQVGAWRFDTLIEKKWRTSTKREISVGVGVYGLDVSPCIKTLGFCGGMRCQFLEKFYFSPVINYDRIYGTTWSFCIGCIYLFSGRMAVATPEYLPVMRSGFVTGKTYCKYETNYPKRLSLN